MKAIRKMGKNKANSVDGVLDMIFQQSEWDKYLLDKLDPNDYYENKAYLN